MLSNPNSQSRDGEQGGVGARTFESVREGGGGREGGGA